MTNGLLRRADPAAAVVADPAADDARRMVRDIVATPRAAMRHRARARRIVIGGAVAGVAAVVALAVPMPWDGSDGGLGSSAYAVSRSADGTVRVEVKWTELTDLPALQAALDRNHARVKIFVSTGPSAPCPARVETVTGYSSRAVQYSNSAGDGFIVRPKYFPAGATLLMDVRLAGPGDGPGTAGPGQPNLSGFVSVMIVGSVPDCMPS